MKRFLGFLFFFFFCFVSLFAHEIKPALLEIKQVDGETYQVVWKVPVTEGKAINIAPVFPKGFVLKKVSERTLANVSTSTYEADYAFSLTGKEISIFNLEKTLIDVFVNVQLLEEEPLTFLVQAKHPAFTIPEKVSALNNAKQYFKLGIAHILEGYDHLLFVLCLLFFITSLGDLLKVVTSFTIAHSITLTLATLNWVTLQSKPVEILILLSIIFLAKEIVNYRRKNVKTLTIKYPWLIAFLFGLIHGFGFSGALKSIGLVNSQLLVTLFSFNLGVEIGQLVFILFVLGIVSVLKLILKSAHYKYLLASNHIPYLIGGISFFWLIQRTLV